MKKDAMVSKQFLKPTEEALNYLVKYSIFYAVADHLKTFLKENFQKIKDIPTEKELDFNKFCDEVLQEPFYEPQMICNDLYLWITEEDFSKNMQERVLEYENGTVVFPDEVMNEIKIDGHDINLWQVGIASSDNVKHDLIPFLWFIIENDYLLNAAVKLALKWMLCDYWKSKDIAYTKVKVDLNEIEWLFDAELPIRPITPKREFLLLSPDDKNSLTEEFGGAENVIKVFEKSLNEQSEIRELENKRFHCLQTMNTDLYFDILTESATRVAVKIVGDEIDKRFGELSDFPTAEEIAKEKVKQETFLDQLYSIAPNGKTLLSIFHDMLIGPDWQKNFEAENDPEKIKELLNEMIEKQQEMATLMNGAFNEYIGATFHVDDLLKHVESYDMDLNEILLSFASSNVTCLLNNYAQVVMVEDNYKFMMQIAIDSWIKNYVVDAGISLESLVTN